MLLANVFVIKMDIFDANVLLHIPFVYKLAKRDLAVRHPDITELTKIDGQWHFRTKNNDLENVNKEGKDRIFLLLNTCYYYIKHANDPFAMFFEKDLGDNINVPMLQMLYFTKPNIRLVFE